MPRCSKVFQLKSELHSQHHDQAQKTQQNRDYLEDLITRIRHQMRSDPPPGREWVNRGPGEGGQPGEELPDYGTPKKHYMIQQSAFYQERKEDDLCDHRTE